MTKQTAPRVAFKTFRKIDIFRKTTEGAPVYLASTNASKTCREACQRYAAIHKVDEAKLFARFDK
jgi:hypothetical protein